MRPLRVGIPAALTRLPPNTSVHRIWGHALPRLRERVSVVVTEPERRWRNRRIDVWLTDGHQGPVAVDQPVVAHLHEASWDLPEVISTFDRAFVDHHAALSARAAGAATRILTVSESSRRQIIHSYDVDPGTVHAVPNGVDLDLHRPGVDGGARLVAGGGGDPDRPYVLFVGTVHPRKNLPVLRAAMERLVRQGLEHGLVLVAGPAPDRRDSSDLLRAACAPIADRPVVNLAGIDDAGLARLMAGADALCLPSLLEGFGMPVVEALACGTPVVVADRGALPEVVGDAGIVVEPTVERVAHGLHRVLTDAEQAAELRRRGPLRAKAFGWDAMVDRWVRVLHDAAGAEPATRRSPSGGRPPAGR